jgi:signal transduction histidine kinase
MERVHTSLHDLISDTIGSIRPRASAQQVTLSGTVDDNVPMLNLAADKIQRVLYNLLDNALNYTPAGGEISVKARLSDEDVLISVHNTGPAIALEDLPHIFTSFYMGERSRAQARRTTRGAGLGLAIARGFVESHGGRLWVESAPEQGTTFTFSLPLARTRIPGEADRSSGAVTRPNNPVPKEALSKR